MNHEEHIKLSQEPYVSGYIRTRRGTSECPVAPLIMFDSSFRLKKYFYDIPQ
jgi:hypothetical protein